MMNASDDYSALRDTNRYSHKQSATEAIRRHTEIVTEPDGDPFPTD